MWVVHILYSLEAIISLPVCKVYTNLGQLEDLVDLCCKSHLYLFSTYDSPLPLYHLLVCSPYHESGWSIFEKNSKIDTCDKCAKFDW